MLFPRVLGVHAGADERGETERRGVPRVERRYVAYYAAL